MAGPAVINYYRKLLSCFKVDRDHDFYMKNMSNDNKKVSSQSNDLEDTEGMQQRCDSLYDYIDCEICFTEVDISMISNGVEERNVDVIDTDSTSDERNEESSSEVFDVGAGSKIDNECLQESNLCNG